jgi:hypothetical protein
VRALTANGHHNTPRRSTSSSFALGAFPQKMADIWKIGHSSGRREGMPPQDHEFRRLKRIFDGDGAEIHEQFILAGLLLTIFERLKPYVVERIDGFFSNHFEVRDGILKYTRGEKFKTLIKEKGLGGPRQHANKEFRAALHWFYDLGAITEDEFNDVERIYSLRNDIGHELFLIIADDNKEPIKVNDVLTTFAVYLKIMRWWVKEVEATTDPDFDQERYDNTKWDEVESPETIFLREIIIKSLLGNADWQEMAEASAKAGVR